MAVDLGAGDGRFVLATAAAQPGTLVLGIDANAASMVEASRRASRPAHRGGLPNALFMVAAAESLPDELSGVSDAVTVHFPWGSLLRGLLRADPVIVGGIARIARAGATVTILLSVTDRDRAIGAPLGEEEVARLVAGCRWHGLTRVQVQLATRDDVAASRSSWGKRLRAGDARPCWLLRFERRSILS